MRVAVLGASGNVGSAVSRELAERGHEVRAIARGAGSIPDLAGVEAVAGDAADPVALAALIRGCDAVISALHFDVRAGTLLSALGSAGVDRLLVTGGAAGLEVAPGVRLIDTPEFPEDWKGIATAGIALLDELRSEEIVDWTYFSPAATIFEGPRTGRFRLGGDRLVVDERGESRISFADFAVAMVDELEEARHSRRRFTAAY